MNPHRWLREHSLKLLAIRDTPNAIAGGVAIGIFFWFPPIIGLKTVGAMLFAWLTRSNILAAVIAVTLHDLFFPLMIVVYRWEYDLGYWLLSHPHHWPQSTSSANWFLHLRLSDWRIFLKNFWIIGKPMMLGSVLLGIPSALASFWVMRVVMIRHQRKKHLTSSDDGGLPVAKD